MFWKKKNKSAPAPAAEQVAEVPPVADTPAAPAQPAVAPPEPAVAQPAPKPKQPKQPKLFSDQARKDARFIQDAFKARRLALRKKDFDVEATPFTDGLEDFVPYDADQPGKTLAGFRDFSLPYARSHHGQIMQDLWVAYELDGKRDGYFVDFGATNGLTMSNSVFLEREFGWTGICAEPNPTFHEKLFKARKCHISTKCVHSKTGDTIDFVCATRAMFSRAGDARDGETLEGDDVEQIVPVETITLNDLLDEYDAPQRIDFMSIDTEGSEYDILTAFDFSKRFVGMFAIEHNYKPVRDEIFALMSAQGYVRRFPELSRFDDWYMHESLLNG